MDSKILATASLGFDASSVTKQVSRMSTFTSMLLYPFMQLEKELRYVDQSSACFMGCLRQVLSQDVGLFCGSHEAPVGAIIRDDGINNLTIQEIMFILAFSMNDVNSAGLLDRSQAVPLTYTDRLQATLLEVYSAIAQKCVMQKEQEINDVYPQTVDEYRLMMVLNELPLMNRRSRVMDLLDLINKKPV